MNIPGNSKDYVIIGLGRFGSEVANQLVEMGKAVTVIDRQEEIVQSIGAKFDFAVVADSTNPETLKDLGIDVNTTVIVAVTELDPSIMTCSALLEIGVNKDNIFVKCKNIAHKRVLSSMQIKHAFIPEIEAARKVAMQSISKQDLDVAFAFKGHTIGRVALTNDEITNIPLSELDFKQRNINIIALVRKSQIIMPSGSVVLKPGDEVIFLTENENMEDSLTLFAKTPEITNLITLPKRNKLIRKRRSSKSVKKS